MAGNYENCVFFMPPDFERPALIRKAVQTMKRAAEPPTKLPTFWFNKYFGSVTNWVSFANPEGFIFPGVAEQELHIPVLDFEHTIALVTYVQAFALVFRAAPGKIGVCFCGKQQDVDRLRKEGILGKPLNVWYSDD